MKQVLIFCLLLKAATSYAQESAPRPELEQQLENQTSQTEVEQEDDSWWQQAESLRRHPLNINTATAAELEVLPMLSGLQIVTLLRYRRLMGRLVDLYELQAIPGWEPETIRKVLPYIVLGEVESMATALGKRLTNGEYSLLLRSAQVLETARGYQRASSTGKNYYEGDRFSHFARYRYQYKNLLQYGFTADKDAGEPFFKGAQKQGFDFYSYHLFVRKWGAIKALALGDFTVNMGQGLIHWQSLAFKKSAFVMQVKRQSEILRPYNAAGEYNFHRGAGITLQYKCWETTAFISVRKLDANLAVDTMSGEEYITSLQTYGLHRTPAEIADRHNWQQVTIGGNIRYAADGWQVGVNSVHYQYSKPFRPSKEPYDLFAITGNRWANHSVNYSYTYHNVHLYGEVAVDQQLKKALLQGMLVSLDPKADISFIYRNINRAYQSVYGNALTENYLPANERGLYAGLALRPAVGWQLQGYADIFRFPWLKYRAGAPGEGAEYLLQLQYNPNKMVELMGRYRYERKPVNTSEGNETVKTVVGAIKQQWRWQVIFQTGKRITLKNRVEVVGYNAQGTTGVEKGFSAFTEVFYKSSRSFAANMRLHYFEADSYNAGIYAYEQDVQYAFSVPLFQDKGFRYYLNIKQDLGNFLRHNQLGKMDAAVWLKFAQFIRHPRSTNGTGPEEIEGRYKTTWKLQCILSWH